MKTLGIIFIAAACAFAQTAVVRQGSTYAAGGGTAQAQTATYSPALSALTDGLPLCWKPTAANTAAAPTFSPNGLTAHPVVKVPNATALAANDLITTQWACAVYDLASTQWELQNPATAVSGGSNPFAYHAYTGTAAFDFSTYTDIKDTASGANPTITIANNPATNGTPVMIGLCNDTAVRTWTLPSSFQRIGVPSDVSECVYTPATWDGANYQGPGSDTTPSVIKFSGTRTAPPNVPAGGVIYPSSADGFVHWLTGSLVDFALVGLTNTQTMTNKTIDGVTPTTMGFLDATSSIQTQLNGKAGAIANGTAALGTSAIASAACATVVTVAASGVASTDVIQFTPCGGLSGWQLMNASSCTGADCTGSSPGAPPSRINASMAYSTVDHKWLLIGGFSGGTTYTDTWTFDPSANSGNGQWTELCSSCGYPAVSAAAAIDGDRLVYDATDNIFEYFANGFNIWVYALSTPLGFGRSAASYAPPTGSLNRNSPPTSPSVSVAQTGALDLSVSNSGATVYLAHSEPSLITDSNCTWPVSYFWSSTASGNWLPTGTADTACTAIGNFSTDHPSGHPYIANVGGTLWEVNDERNISGQSSVMQAMYRTYSGGTTGTWSGGAVGCFSGTCGASIAQYPQGLVAAGSTPFGVFIENNSFFNANSVLYLAQWTGSAWSSVTGSTALNHTTGTAVSYAAIGVDSSNDVGVCWAESVEGRTAVTTPPQIWAKVWNGTTISALGSTFLNQSSTAWASSCSISNISGTWYVTWTERPRTGNSQLYVAALNSGSWSLVGTGSLNINPATGWPAHPTLAADGASLYLGWQEQSATGSHALGYVQKWNGSAWTSVAGPVATDLANGSIADFGIVANSGTVTAGWRETTWGNLPQVYSTSFTAGHSTPPQSICGGCIVAERQ